MSPFTDLVGETVIGNTRYMAVRYLKTFCIIFY